MGKALYRVYRSKSFDELVGQDHITRTLKNALSKGHINHAYLFTGPRGVGKTSVARILAHQVNQIPYLEETSHIDIIEIDAASNRRIDEIREIRNKVHIAPVMAKYKVYIVDEVHMLTKEAFNALLKTLEEPPEHVIFILATTEIHKLPETIVSRCLRFTFHPVSSEDVTKHLLDIAKQESIDIDKKTANLIAQHGGGSFRDSISLLEQVRNIDGGKISIESVQNVLGLASDELIKKLISAVTTGDVKGLTSILTEAKKIGANDNVLAKQIAASIRQNLIDDQLVLPKSTCLDLLKELINVPSSSNPSAELELLLIKNALSTDSRPHVIHEEPEPPKQVPELKATIPQNTVEEAPKYSGDSSVDQLWQDSLNELKKTNNTLYGIARMAKPEAEDETLVLKFKFGFHFKQLNESKNKTIISNIVHTLNPAYKTVSPVHEPSTESVAEKSTAPKKDFYESITNIFGEGEVIES